MVQSGWMSTEDLADEDWLPRKPGWWWERLFWKWRSRRARSFSASRRRASTSSSRRCGSCGRWLKRHLGPNRGWRGGGLASTRRNEESSAAAARESSTEVKSKTESREAAARAAGPAGLRVQSAIRPSLSEREKGAKGMEAAAAPPPRDAGAGAVSGGPQPSGLKATTPTSKPMVLGGGGGLDPGGGWGWRREGLGGEGEGRKSGEFRVWK
uniref:Uncharacterized protein n=1 Tax=Oryza glumipatula TaxID=40148 RepID=A0A0E0A2V7_9ORYZ